MLLNAHNGRCGVRRGWGGADTTKDGQIDDDEQGEKMD